MPAPPLRLILAATDLTEAADSVLRGAAALASLAAARLHVLYAIELQPLPYDDARISSALLGEAVASAQRRLQEQIRRAIPATAAEVSWEVVSDVPYLAILDRAQRMSADLIVLGPHRELAFGDGFLGTTADRVIRTAQVPCLILRGPLSLPLRRVVVPIDLSSPARGALDLGLQWASALGARDTVLGMPHTELRVVHVTPESSIRQGFTPERAVVGPRLTTEVRQAIERLGDSPDIEVRQEVVWSNQPREAILRYAREEGADLLVLGTHGYGALKRILIGSVASAVARRAPCPLLLVPPPLWQTRPEQVSPAQRSQEGEETEPVPLLPQ